MHIVNTVKMKVCIMRIKKSFVSRQYFKGGSFLRQLILLLCVCIGGCHTSPLLTAQNVKGVIGASDPVIRTVGQNILENGGNAADAMAAMLFSGAVAFPSRMGLGAGGVCQVLDPSVGRVKTLHFLPIPAAKGSLTGLPGLARGVYALQNTYGILRWNAVLSDAISKATDGVVVSEQLAKDILLTPELNSSWTKLKKGDLLVQEELAETLHSISNSGSGVLYKKEVAEKLNAQGANINPEWLKSFRAIWMDSIDVASAKGRTYFVNPTFLSSEGYTIWKDISTYKNFAKRAKGMKALEEIEAKTTKESALFKGVGLFAGDENGLNIVCSVSMGKPFGQGKIMQEGFSLSQAVYGEQDDSYFLNILQTNPDITDVYWAGAGVGEYGLVDGLKILEETLLNDQELNKETSNQILKITGSRQEDFHDFVLWKCSKGYPNQPASCETGENMQFIFEKE